jgi:ADP-ribose pyrophosphatase YjhB (NUDIX family)
MSYNFRGEIRFCPHCGSPIDWRDDTGARRPHCPQCHLTYFQDPKLAVAILIEHDGGLLLQRRAIDPGKGKWTFPSGYVDRGECVEDAAIRETLEETGLEVRLHGLLGLYSDTGNPVVLAVYAADVVGGRVVASDESDDIASFPVDDLPELAFPHDPEIVAVWHTQRRPNGPVIE